MKRRPPVSRQRALRLESLEKRLLLTTAWRNPVDALDVNQDRIVTALDALVVINTINRRDSEGAPAELEPRPVDSTDPYFDVTGEGRLTALDALRIINSLSLHISAGQYALRESEQNVDTQLPITISLGSLNTGTETSTRTYQFDIEASFDSDSDSDVQDALAVYLVDPDSPQDTLLDQGEPGTALFVLSGQRADYIPGLVRFDGQTVSFDLTELKDRQTGQLVFQLISQNERSDTAITIRPHRNDVDPDGMISPRLMTAGQPSSPGESIDITQLTPATSGHFEVDLRNMRFDRTTGRYDAELQVINRGQTVGRDLAIAFPGLPDGVSLEDSAGMTSDGHPLLSLRPAIAAGGLGTGQRSEPVRVSITTQNMKRFHLATVVYVGQPNRAPVFPQLTPITIRPGARIDVELGATDPDGDRVMYSLPGADGLTMRLSGTGVLSLLPTPSQVGSHTLTVIASDGRLNVEQELQINVVADPVVTTRISGQVLDVDSTPLQGLQVEVGGVQGLTLADGRFTLDLGSGPLVSDTLKIRGETFIDPSRPNVVYPFIAEKLAFMLERPVFESVNNQIIRPIYLPKLDIANGMPIDPMKDMNVTTAAIPGASVFVSAGSLMNQQGVPFQGVLSITEVPADLTPAALPNNLFPDLVVTIQPGEMVFTAPAPMTFPNRSGWAPGTLMDLWSINPVTGEFDDVGDMRVNTDGSMIESISGGVRNSSWHFPAPRPPEPIPKPDNDECEECEKTAPANSEVNFNSGALTEMHELVTYQSLGQTRGVTLNYDSIRADARPIVHFAYDDINPNIFSVPDALKVVARLSVNLNGVDYVVPGFADAPQFGLRGGEHFFSIPAGGGPLDAALQVDLRGQPTGTYTYTLNAGLRGFTGRAFIGSEDVSRGRLIHVNTVDSPFGSGWGVNGLQELVQNADGSLLLVDGNGSASVFSKAPDARRDLLVLGKSNNILRYHETTGAFEGTFAAAGLGGLNDPKDAVFGPDGNLYVTNFGGKNVLRFDGQSGAFIDVFVEQGSGGLSFPTVLAFGPDGNLYVGQGGPGNTGGGGNVLRYDGSTGAFLDVFADAKAVAGLDLVNGLTFGPDGNLYVTSTDRFIFNNTDRVLRFNGSTGAFLNTFVAPAQLDDAGALTFGPNGDLYIIDARFNHVQRYNGTTGAFVGVFTSGDSLSTAFDLQFGPDGNLYVASRGNDQVQQFNGTTGALIDQFVSAGDGGLDEPQAIVFRPSTAGVTSKFVAPPGDFSEFEKMFDGTFRRTTPDQTVSIFDINGRIERVTDRHGNQTRYTYDVSGLLTEITDPVGLLTKFTYTAGKVATITDPAGRVTRFDHDAAGNLIRVTDPDGTQRNWEYDTDHHMTAETNKRGDREQSFYDEFGRAERALRADGSIIEINPGQVQGLYPPDRTIDPANAPEAFRSAGGDASYLDGNGNLIRSVLDAAGQEVSSSDSVGPLPTVERNNQNLIARNTDARGNATDYTYDARGNLLTVRDSISGLRAGGTVTIDGRTNIFGAGQTVAPAPGGGGAGLLPMAVTIPPQEMPRVLKFGEITGQVTGNTSRCPFNGPDGGVVCRDSVNVDPFGGISGLRHDARNVFLVGVFLDETQPVDPPPPTLNFTDADNTSEFSPLLRQVFFIGNGRTTAGVAQQFDVPAGATRLFMGFVDNFSSAPDNPEPTGWYNDNGGSLTVPYEFENDSSSELRYTYDPKFSQRASQTDELGHQTLHDIDPANGNVRSITQVIGAVGGPDDLVTQFTYTSQGLIDTETDPLGRVTDYDYDALGRLITVTLAEGTADEGVRRFEYDAAGNLDAMVDENGLRTDYAFDSLNRLTRITEPDPDAAGPLTRPVTEFAYDAAGNLTRATDARGNISRSEYDTRNRTSKTIDPNEGETSYAYDLAGNRISVTDPLGQLTRYRYDARNRIIETLDPDNGLIKFAYDSDDNTTAVIDPTGNRTEFEYDARNRVTRETVQVEAPFYTNNFEIAAGPEWSNNQTNVTPQGNRRFLGQFGAETTSLSIGSGSEILPEGLPTHDLITVSFDLFMIRTMDGNNAQFGPDSWTLSVGDGGPTLLSTTFSNHPREQFGVAFDQAFPGTSTNPPINNPARTGAVEIDTLGYGSGFQGDSVYHLTFTFPHTANALQLNFTGGQDSAIDNESWGLDNVQVSARQARSYEYDATDKLISQTDRDGRRTEYTYDDVNRRIGELWVDGGNAIAYAYDKANNLLSTTDSFSGLAMTYDARDRVRTVDNAGTPGVPNVVLTYAYDPAGNLLSTADTIASAAGGLNSYTYDGLNRMTRITQTGTNVSDKRVDLTYNPLGQFSSLQRFQDLTNTQLVVGSDYTYDSLNRLTGLHHRNAAQMDVSFFDFVHDTDSRITRITDIDGATDYAYDNRDQLVAADHADANNPDEAYSYDANGNRLTSSRHGNGYVTGPNNRLLSDGMFNYAYDAEGNLTRRTEIATDNYREFQWDYRNRLTAVIDKTGTNLEIQRVMITYDALDRCIAKAVDTTPLDAVDAAVSYFVYDGPDVLLDFVDVDGSGATAPELTQRYLHGPEVDQILAQDNGAGNVLWHLSDHLGTVRDLANNSGTVVNHLTYDSYGNVIVETNPVVDTRYQFTGREFDPETSLHYYRARYFDAATGRFLNEDPMGFAAGDANLHRYVGNAPINRSDPTGMGWWEDYLEWSINNNITNYETELAKELAKKPECRDKNRIEWLTAQILIEKAALTDLKTKGSIEVPDPLPGAKPGDFNKQQTKVTNQFDKFLGSFMGK